MKKIYFAPKTNIIPLHLRTGIMTIASVGISNSTTTEQLGHRDSGWDIWSDDEAEE